MQGRHEYRVKEDLGLTPELYAHPIQRAFLRVKWDSGIVAKPMKKATCNFRCKWLRWRRFLGLATEPKSSESRPIFKTAFARSWWTLPRTWLPVDGAQNCLLSNWPPAPPSSTPVIEKTNCRYSTETARHQRLQSISRFSFP